MMRVLRKIVELAALAFLSLGAALAEDCCSDTGWITPLAEEGAWNWSAPPLDDGSIFRLKDRAAALAVQMLDSSGPVILMDRTALQILAPEVKVPEGTTPYLVRAVALDEPLGHVGVVRNGDDVMTVYNGPIVQAPCHKQPLILFLKSSPKRFYVAVRLYS